MPWLSAKTSASSTSPHLIVLISVVGWQITLQYCLWDQFKEAATAPPRRAANLARFVATVIANFGLSISLFKVSFDRVLLLPTLAC